MKTIVRQNTNVSLYLFEDDVVVNVYDTQTEIGSPVIEIILDCSSDNIMLYENVTPPEDWVGTKYCFDGETWTLNPNYVPPRPIPVQE